MFYRVLWYTLAYLGYEEFDPFLMASYDRKISANTQPPIVDPRVAASLKSPSSKLVWFHCKPLMKNATDLRYRPRPIKPRTREQENVGLPRMSYVYKIESVLYKEKNKLKALLSYQLYSKKTIESHFIFRRIVSTTNMATPKSYWAWCGQGVTNYLY